MAKITSVSPLAPAAFPDLPVIDGVRFASVAAGVRYAGRTDVMLTLLDPGSVVAGVFTRSATRSANVLDCQAKIGSDSDDGAAIIVNSGNSNAFTGKAGDGSVAAICEAVATATGLPATRVFTSSTGVIGERLPHDRIIARVGDLVAALDPGTTGAVVTGPIPLPTHKKIFTVLRSPHVNKKSREQFQLSSYKRLLDIYSSSSKTIDALMKLELPSGVEVEIKV